MKKKGPAAPDPLGNEHLQIGYATCSSALLRGLRRIATPIAPKPSSIIAHVAGSGTAGVPVEKICAFDEPWPFDSVIVCVTLLPRSSSQTGVLGFGSLSIVLAKCAPTIVRPDRFSEPKFSVAEPLRSVTAPSTVS